MGAGIATALLQAGKPVILNDEGVALRACDVDVALVNGRGFPRWRGGPVHWARQQDGMALAQVCAEFAQTSGLRQELADLRSLGVETGGTT